MIKASLLALLVALALGASTFSYTFSAQATSSQVRPSYPLGALTQNSTLIVTFQIPFPSGDTLSSFIVNIMDSNNTNPVQALSFTGTNGNATWVVTANASYFLQVTTASAGFSSITMYYLSATVNNVAILRLTDVLRQRVFKYFYVSPSDSGNVTVTMSPSSGSSVTLLVMNAGTQFSVMSSTSPIASTTINGVSTYKLNGLASGYYGLAFQTAVVVSATVSFQSSPYACPFSSNFADYNAVFMGCTSSSGASSSGLPCTNYDFVTLTCLSCLSGYTLKNGACTISTSCNPREYYKFGFCYPVSSSCGDFDPYTGNCYTCAETSFTVVNGQCIPNNITFCAPGTKLFNTLCIPNNCSAASANGSCTACVSSAYVLSNGSCIEINCGIGFYFSTTLNNCTGIPVGCTNFSTLNQSCYSCNMGYFAFNNTCVQPNNSANCQVWDFNNKVCSQCNLGFTWNNVLCILTIASNCLTGQVLINNQCVNLPPNCLTINIFQICMQCDSGYTIQKGSCVKCTGPNPFFPCKTCPIDQYIDATGACRLASPECSSVNQATGLCNTCKSGASPVGGVCCPSGQSVINGVCIAQQPSQGQVPLSPQTDFAGYYKYCRIYSPPRKLCIECINGRSFDYADHCA